MGATHAEETMCAKTQGREHKCQGLRRVCGLREGGRWHELRSQAELEPEALRPQQGV